MSSQCHCSDLPLLERKSQTHLAANTKMPGPVAGRFLRGVLSCCSNLFTPSRADGFIRSEMHVPQWISPARTRCFLSACCNQTPMAPRLLRYITRGSITDGKSQHQSVCESRQPHLLLPAAGCPAPSLACCCHACPHSLPAPSPPPSPPPLVPTCPSAFP